MRGINKLAVIGANVEMAHAILKHTGSSEVVFIDSEKELERGIVIRESKYEAPLLIPNDTKLFSDAHEPKNYINGKKLPRNHKRKK